MCLGGCHQLLLRHLCLDLFDLSHHHIIVEASQNWTRRRSFRAHSPSHVCKRPSSGMKWSGCPPPITQEFADCMFLCAMWYWEKLIDVLNTDGHVFDPWPEMSPCRLFIILLHSDAVLLFHTDQADGFVIGSAEMHHLFVRISRHPNDPVTIIMLPGLVTTGLNVDPVGSGGQKFGQSSIWDAHEDRVRSLILCDLSPIVVYKAPCPKFKDHVVNVLINSRMEFVAASSTVGTTA